MSYVPLWCRSNFSFLDGASHPDELVEQAHALGIEALALTDRDGVHGMVRAHVKAKELGVRLIVGAEVTVGDAAGMAADAAGAVADTAGVAAEAATGGAASLSTAAPLSTCVLLAANRTGYANLCRLITAGRLRRPKGESRVTWPEVCERAEGLVALWGGDRSLLVRDAEPRAVAGALREAFGDRLYALAARHRRAEEVRQEACLRRHAGPCLPAPGRRYRGAVSHAGAPRPAGRPHLHPPRRNACCRRPADQAECRARSEVAAKDGGPVRR